jgi:hypothetical protein
MHFPHKRPPRVSSPLPPEKSTRHRRAGREIYAYKFASLSMGRHFLFKYHHRLPGRCASKTPKHPPRNPAGAAPAGAAAVFVLLFTNIHKYKNRSAGGWPMLIRPRSAIFRGHRSAGGFLFTRRAPACAAEPPKLRVSGAAPGRRANFNSRGLRSIGGPLPCKQQTPERNRQAPTISPVARPSRPCSHH